MLDPLLFGRIYVDHGLPDPDCKEQLLESYAVIE